MKQKYCFSCFQDRPIEGGKVIKTSIKSIGRFKCERCLAKIKRPKNSKVIESTPERSTHGFRAA
jgi:hypothetical protein